MAMGPPSFKDIQLVMQVVLMKGLSMLYAVEDTFMCALDNAVGVQRELINLNIDY